MSLHHEIDLLKLEIAKVTESRDRLSILNSAQCGQLREAFGERNAAQERVKQLNAENDELRAGVDASKWGAAGVTDPRTQAQSDGGERADEREADTRRMDWIDQNRICTENYVELPIVCNEKHNVREQADVEIRLDQGECP